MYNRIHHDGAIISMIISMAKHLELKVIAEGVEEVDQLAFLTERDCDMYSRVFVQ